MVDFAAHSANMINRIGKSVTIVPRGGPHRTVMAVVAVSAADVFQAENYRFQTRMAMADAECVEVGDCIHIDSSEYTVARRDIDPQGGTVVLHLK